MTAFKQNDVVEITNTYHNDGFIGDHGTIRNIVTFESNNSVQYIVRMFSGEMLECEADDLKLVSTTTVEQNKSVLMHDLTMIEHKVFIVKENLKRILVQGRIQDILAVNESMQDLENHLVSLKKQGKKQC